MFSGGSRKTYILPMFRRKTHIWSLKIYLVFRVGAPERVLSAVADAGLQIGDRDPQRWGRQVIVVVNFSRKPHENEHIVDREGASC